MRVCTAGVLAAVLTAAVIAVPPLEAQLAQERPSIVAGVVLEMPAAKPLADARVQIGPATVRSKADGTFRISGVSRGDAELTATVPGLPPRVVAINVANDSQFVYVRMARAAVLLERVVVTAEEAGTAVSGTSVSRIARDAIEHVQASSLADVLQLVPGQPALNPSLAAPRQSLIRQAPTAGTRDPGPGTDAERANALGTAIVVDGVPVSNNANLQTSLTILNSGPATLPPFASTADRGVDLRQFSADNIESVEVVRGIPSVRYGDLTAGAILVTSRAGQQRPEFRIRANPLAVELSSAAGWGSTPSRGFLLHGNVTRSQDDARSTLDQFTRASVDASWSASPWRSMASTMHLRLFSVIDAGKRDPDDSRYQRATSSRDQGLRADARFRIGDASAIAVQTELTASVSYALQSSKYSELITRDIFPLTAARRDTLAPGVYGRSEYLTSLTVDGRPLNGYLRLESTRATRLRGWRLQPRAGFEFRYDDNRGRGRQFDALEPPRQNYAVGDRPDDLSRVRATTQFAPYAEHRLRGRVARRAIDATFGVRLDVLDAGGKSQSASVAPRGNVQWQLTRAVGVHAGYGRTTKAPTLSQRYPAPRYFDLVSYNYYAVNPAERLVVFTTRVIDPTIRTLRAAQATKTEVGIDAVVHGLRASLAYFGERTANAFGTTRSPIGIVVPKLRALAFPVGRPPVLDPEPVRVDPFVGLYDSPRNSRRIATRGIEGTADIPEWRAVHTGLSVSGGWFDTRASDEDVDIPVEQFVSGTTQPLRVGVYASGRGSQGSRFLTAIRLIHRLPDAGLVTSLVLQTTWFDDDRPIGRLDGFPLGFIDLSGQLHPLTPAQAMSPENASLRRAVLDANARWERRPPLQLVNVRITKALPARSQLALFANNALASLPLYRRQRQPGFERRNQPQFFGIEFLSSL